MNTTTQQPPQPTPALSDALAACEQALEWHPNGFIYGEVIVPRDALHAVLAAARAYAALVPLVVEWHAADVAVVAEMCAPGGPSGPVVARQIDAEDRLHEVAVALESQRP